MKLRFLIMVGLASIAACRAGDRPTETAVADSADSPRAFVDSVFPVDEQIRRFKAARGGAAAAELTGASSTRDALVERLMRALETRDTAELSAMVLNAAEFVDLYYPTSIYSRPPYRQSPELLWFLIQQNSQKGIGRVLDRYAGVPPRFTSYSCRVEPTVWGDNLFWEHCTVQWAPTPDAPSPFKLFGGIMERDGRFKFVSYANDL